MAKKKRQQQLPFKEAFSNSDMNPLMKWPYAVPVLIRKGSTHLNREECILLLQEIMEEVRKINPPARFDVMLRILEYRFNVLDWHQAQRRYTYNRSDVFNATWYSIGYTEDQCPKGKELAELRFHG
jgi:hypothetical protein